MLGKPIQKQVIRLAALSFAFVALLFLAWQIVFRTTAAALTNVDPTLALAWEPQWPSALLRLAERRLPFPVAAADKAAAQPDGSLTARSPVGADLVEARAMAEEALRADPLAPGALTDLARVAEAQGETRRAAALMELAGRRALRDAFAQAWLVNHALVDGDPAAALVHVDAILRTHPEALDGLQPLLAALVAYPQTSKPLARLLETEPPWRGQALESLGAQIADLSALRRLYAELKDGPHPPSEQEIQPFLDRLVKAGADQEAYATWIEALPAGRRADKATLYNGAFQYPLSGSEFDWRVTQGLGADVEVVDEGAGEPRMLRVEFSGARVDFRNVNHLMALPPRAYRLTGEVEAEALHTTRGLWWRLFCVATPDKSLGQTELVTESAPWRNFALLFTVPANDCGAQILQLELPARIALEQEIAGVVSYRNLAIGAQPGADENPAPAKR